MALQKITPNLWFDDRAEEAAHYYASIFPSSRVGTISHYGEAGAQASGRPKGSVMTVEFELDGQRFLGLNGGPVFKFDEAVSFIVECETQEEIDHYWDNLSAGGEEGPCGWLKDKFGLSWQITPKLIRTALADPDPAKFDRVMAEVLQMKKLDLATLRRAYEGA